MSVLGDRLKAGIVTERTRADIRLGSDTITIYATPITGADMEFVARRHKDFAQNPTVAAAVDLIIHKAEDEHGNKAFDVGDKPILLRLPMQTLGDIRDSLFPEEVVDDESIEAEIKN